MKLTKVISGGQTGADIAGVVMARRYGLLTGGWMPRGYRTQAGPQPVYGPMYGMRTTEEYEYGPRTEANVREADVTIRFAEDFGSPGEVLTEAMLRKHGKPYLDVDLRRQVWQPADIAMWLVLHGAATLNVAGNSELTCPGIEIRVMGVLSEVFGHLQAYPTLYNRHHRSPASADAVYIGRGTVWGNDHYTGNRDKDIAAYYEGVKRGPEFVAMVRAELRGKDLMCSCAPARCHGDILLALANSTGNRWSTVTFNIPKKGFGLA